MPLILDPNRPSGHRQVIAARIANSIAMGGKEDLESAFEAVLAKLASTNPSARTSPNAREAEEHFEHYGDNAGPEADHMRRIALMGVALLLDDVHLNELDGMAAAFLRNRRGGEPPTA